MLHCTAVCCSVLQCVGHIPHSKVLALGGAPLPRRYIARWARGQEEVEEEKEEGESRGGQKGGWMGTGGMEGGLVEMGRGGVGGAVRRVRLLNTYGVTEASVYQTVADTALISRYVVCV